MNALFKFTLMVFAAALVLMLACGAQWVAHNYGPMAALGAVGLVLMAPTLLTKHSHVLGVAATAAVNTPFRTGDLVFVPVAAATKIFQGTLVARDAAGRAVPASNTAGLRVIGRAEETIDNSTGAAGDLSINVRAGVFKFANSGTSALTIASVGKMAVVEDDNTVAAAASQGVSAGRVTALDDDGVWVDTRFAYYGPKTVTTLTSADGVAAAAADLAALKVEAEKIGDDIRALHASLFG